MKKLLSCIAALFTIFSLVSCLQEERSPEEILVPSPAEVDCSESFSITSKVPKGSEKLVEECGFLVGTTKDLADALTVEGAMTENTFSAALPARKYGTTYYICSYVTNGHSSEIRSEVISYDLKPLKEYIEFEPVELVSYSKANRKAEVSFRAEIWSGVSVSETGVCFGVTTSPSEDGKHQSGNMSEDGVVTATLSNFDVDTQYYLRAYVKDGESVAYGEVIPLIIRISPPSLTSVIVSSVGASSALFSSSVTDNGGDAMRFLVDAACGCNIGKVRRNNEDNFFFDDKCTNNFSIFFIIYISVHNFPPHLHHYYIIKTKICYYLLIKDDARASSS